MSRKKQNVGAINKRKENVPPKQMNTKKESAQGATKKGAVQGGKAKANLVEQNPKQVQPKISLTAKVNKIDNPGGTTANSKGLRGKAQSKIEGVETATPQGTSRVLRKLNTIPVTCKRSCKTVRQRQSEAKKDGSKEESSISSSSSEVSPPTTPSTKQVQNRGNENSILTSVPAGVVDYDKEVENDLFQVSLYAKDIFAYYKRRELQFPIKKYLEGQTQVNRFSRSILVDWMVEVQQSFELNHETLYLAVKLLDMFIGKTSVPTADKLQLVGTTTLYIASKYVERCPPYLDDFCYLCADTYEQKEFLQMEERILCALEFDIGVPLSYKFLRRYARSANLDMETLTLARYILEMSLMEYEFIDVLDSLMAASALFLALKLKGNYWNATLQYYTSYSVNDIFKTTQRLYAFMRNQPFSTLQLKIIQSKYSHKAFFEVAKIPFPKDLQLAAV